MGLSLSLFVPLYIIYRTSLFLINATIWQQPEPVREDWYANLYAVLALLWGAIWGTTVRDWLRGLLTKGDNQ